MSLKSITIPDSVIKIGYNVFYKCASLNAIIFSSKSPLLEKIKNKEYEKWGLEKDQIKISVE